MRTGMRIMVRAIGVCVIFVAMGGGASESSAQTPRDVYRYRLDSQRPAVSPYLDMFRANTGVLPNYHTFVKPRIDQRYQQQQQWQAIRQLQMAPTSRTVSTLESNQLRATGQGGFFDNYLHYYQRGVLGR